LLASWTQTMAQMYYLLMNIKVHQRELTLCECEWNGYCRSTKNGIKWQTRESFQYCTYNKFIFVNEFDKRAALCTVFIPKYVWIIIRYIVGMHTSGCFTGKTNCIVYKRHYVVIAFPVNAVLWNQQLSSNINQNIFKTRLEVDHLYLLE